jgi:phosphoserine phosphatase
MSKIALVLTAAPGSPVITGAHAKALLDRLPAGACPRWLAEGEAWEAMIANAEATAAGAVESAGREILNSLPVDINVVPAGSEGRRKKLLVADMESTIIGQEFIDELADCAGLGPEIAAITARAMQGEIEFEAALRERVARFKGLDAAILEDVYARATLNPGAETLVKTMKKHGAACALVSGGFTVFTERIAARAGFDVHQANTLEIEGGKLKGTVAEPILGREAKREALERLAREHGIAIADTIAVGDGANDLAMIRAAGLGVAFRAKPIVATEARASIVHGDLTALLYLQGYRKEDFAE